MYCPKCGRSLVTKDDALTCIKGDMPLSRALQRFLLEAYPVQRPRVTNEVGADISRYYCPGCGEPLDKELACSICGKTLPAKIRYNLIELHPHRAEDREEWV